MGSDLQGAAEFYDSALGAVTARMVRARLLQMWPHASGQTLLGLGFAEPYLSCWTGTAQYCIAAGSGEAASRIAGRFCFVEEDALPFAESSLDRVLLVHGLENADNAQRMLREVWRVLRDDGSLLIVAPNRVGLWAHLENTPFGQGRPYSPGQIERLLAASLFRVERQDSALYLPPTRWRAALRSAAAIERMGRKIVPQLAGVTITEAVKDVYAGIPLRRVKRRRLAMVEAR